MSLLISFIHLNQKSLIEKFRSGFLLFTYYIYVTYRSLFVIIEQQQQQVILIIQLLLRTNVGVLLKYNKRKDKFVIYFIII